MARRPVDAYENPKLINKDIQYNIIKEPSTKKQKVSTERIHAGHRERLRDRFLKNGLDDFQPHNVLELLLFFAIPQKDTNVEAHSLINTFGSLSEVFDADFDDLCRVKGIGPRTATLIKLMPELFRKYETDKLNKDEIYLNSAQLVAEYTSKYFKGVSEEKLFLLCLDSNCKVLNFTLISEGNINSTPINNRKIAETAFVTNTSSIILVHNHPSGIAAPSKADIDATIKLIETMKLVGIRLNDHIIIGNGDDYFSFRRSDKWKYLFD